MSSRITSNQRLMSLIKDSKIIVSAMAASEPQILFSSLSNIASQIGDTTVICANPSQNYQCFEKKDGYENLRFEVLFLTSPLRDRQGFNRIHYIPQHLSQWVDHLKMNRPTIDVFWGSCTPPDSRGIVSLGPSCCYESEIFQHAKIRVLEINPNLPFCSGAGIVRISDVDFFIESDCSIPTIAPTTSSSTDRAIAANIAELVPDGATIQLGIGGIPNALRDAFKSKKDLGVHTEMINDCIVNLIEDGIVTGRKKTIWPNRVIGAFALGTQKVYDFLNHNPLAELHPASVVNDPYRIARNHKMISINTAVEIDLTGQVCSESIGHRELSGVGGATDTHIGAQRSPGGRGIIALSATGFEKATNTTFSKIVFELRPGAKVSISRNDIDTVVTEFGAGQLRGKSVAERAKLMISLAAPEFRDGLLANAKAANYI